MNSKTNFLRVGGYGNAIFTSPDAFAEHEDLARREHVAILTFRANLAAGMPLEDAESFLRMDLHELAIDDEEYIQSIVDNPDRDSENVFACAVDMVED